MRPRTSIPSSSIEAPSNAVVPPLARIAPPSVFYGWWLAAACMIIMFVTVGVSYYGLALFVGPLREEHGWSNSIVLGATGTFFLLSGVSSFVAGPWIDSFGPRRFLAFGIVLTAVGAASVGFVNQVWQLYLAYAVLASAYGLGAVVPVSTLMSRWFIYQRAKAMMIASTGVSLGGAILVPIGAILIENGGLRLAAPTMGLLVIAVALPVLWLTVAESPADLGLEPDGGHVPPRSRVDASSQFRQWNRATTIRTTAFWSITTAFFLCLGAQTAVLINQFTFLEQSDKLGNRPAAALAVTTTTVGSIVARFIVSLFADALDKRLMAAGLMVAQAGAIGGYVVVSSTVGVYAVALLFGFTVGNIYMSQSLLVGEIFGLTSFATVFGMVALAGQIGSGLALIGMGGLTDRFGYTVPFLVLAALDLVAAAVVMSARLPGEARTPPGQADGRGQDRATTGEPLASASG